MVQQSHIDTFCQHVTLRYTNHTSLLIVDVLYYCKTITHRCIYSTCTVEE